VPRFLLNFVHSGGFHFSALSNNVRERGQHITVFHPNITIVLYHQGSASAP
jgi:hypothetical protein